MRAAVVTMLCAGLLGGASDACAEALHVEPGLWEVTYNYSLQGRPPAQVLARLPPEERAGMEAKWAARVGQTKTNSTRTCVTEDELANGTAFDNGDDAPLNGCERSVGTQTATRWTAVEHCTSATDASVRNVEINARGPRNVSGAMNAVKGEAAAASGINMTFSGKWIAKDCGAP